ncbi:AraC family transcriptional regulator [Pseudonocardia sp. NPDC049635]|uniref:AraC family transcriptional regulator n=1 Tax=Pseudonocardia sp. NPDC049635 TaxID=3155506 RepID=UPI0033FBFE4A
MNPGSLPHDEVYTAGDLVAAIRARCPKVGANSGAWPGLTFYHYLTPAEPTWEEVRSLSLCIIAQGRKRVVVDGAPYCYDPFNYLVLSNSQNFTAQVLEASPAMPYLSLVLQIDPVLVRRVSSDLLERRTTTFSRPAALQGPDRKAFITPLDSTLMAATMRFLQATDDGADRRVLAPLYLQEIVYRILQAEQFARLLQVAAQESERNPISDVLAYVHANLAEPLTVSDMAEKVSLSPSAFSHLFRDVTGKSPYQFVKELRLNRARELLLADRLSVTQISRAVGYGSTSHFIREFRDRFGSTPRAYCNLHTIGEQFARGTATP